QRTTTWISSGRRCCCTCDLMVSVPAMVWFEVDRIRAKEGPPAARHRDLPGDEYRRVVIIAVPPVLDVKTADQIREGVVVHILQTAVVRPRVVVSVARWEQPEGVLDDVRGIERRRS